MTTNDMQYGRPGSDADPTAVAMLAHRSMFPTTIGRTGSLTVDEVRRVEQLLLGRIAAGESLPTMRMLAAEAGISRVRLRRAIGRVGDAADALIDERISVAWSCIEMPSGWDPSLTALGERIVTHRTYVFRVVAGVAPAATGCRDIADELAEIDRALDDDLRYHLRRWRVFDEREDVDRLAADIGAALSISRLRRIDTGSMIDLHRQLNHELALIFTRFGLFERWNERRHEAVVPHDLTPASGIGRLTEHARAS